MQTQYVGLDVHKKFTYAVVIDQNGKELLSEQFSNEPAHFDRFLKGVSKDAKFVMEACSCWQFIYDYLDDAGYDVKLAHPLKVKAIASARIKTDKIDAKILAQLLRADLIPESYVPPHYVRKERNVVRHRQSQVRMRTQIKNKIHAILIRHGINYEWSSVFTHVALEYLESLDLPDADRFALDQYLRQVDMYNHLIEEADGLVDVLCKENPHAQLLTSMPGVGYYSALLIMSEIGDIRRFKSPKQLCSYAGLVPSVYQSGNTLRYGKITKQGSQWLRWILTQDAHVAIHKDDALATFHKRVKRRKGHKAATVATARKMLTYMHRMLVLNVPYQALHIKRGG